MLYMNDYCRKHTDEKIQYKIKKDKWIEFNKIKTRKAVLNDSLFLRYMQKKITRNSGDKCNDFIVVKFNYDVIFKNSIEEISVKKHDLRTKYYKDGVTYYVNKKNKETGKIEENPIHYKMLMRSPGKAKKGECIFIRDNLHNKAINFLTMDLYDLMTEKAKNNPDAVFKLVELSAYLTLTTATSVGYIHIPLENILIVKDESVYSDPMKAEIVKEQQGCYFQDEFVVDFDDPKTEKLINKHDCTFHKEKAEKEGLIYTETKTKDALKQNGIRINGWYPGRHEYVKYNSDDNECVVIEKEDAKIKNVLWDGMGLIDESIFPEYAKGFIYCRSHFFKSCLFVGRIQQFFKDWCEKNGHDYNTYTTTDMFGNKIKLSDTKVIVTDKSLKWLKFVDIMGGTEEKAYKTYRKYMRNFDDCFSIVKTSHPSKWGDLQLMTYQMNNSLPTTDSVILERITKEGIDFCNKLKTNDEAYLQYLNRTQNLSNINEVFIALVKRNPDFAKTEFFRKKKTSDINKLKQSFKEGRLPQAGDNFTIMDNPIALLMKSVGENPLDEGCFKVIEDGVQCYTPRFQEGESLAAFRSPHNSPNNIIHLCNVYPEKLIKYFPNIGSNVIVFNAIKTDTQARLSGHDVDSDFVYVTNQPELAELSREAYIEYPTIINDVKELDSSIYHFTLEDYAKMDNQIADAQESIGTSTDTAQLALSYFYDEVMESRELKECFIILSVIGQISIDLAKKEYNLDVVKEIRRIKTLPCMKGKPIPEFFANTKKTRNNKTFKDREIKSMNCPMDIMANILDDKIITYADRDKHLPLRDFFNTEIKGHGNRYKKEKVIKEAETYNNNIRSLMAMESQMDEDTIFQLTINYMKQFLNKAAKNLDQETIMQLVIYASKDENKMLRSTIFNFLFTNYREEFLNCFVKK